MPKTREPYHHGDLRSSLLKAALNLLKTRPPTELSLRELARVAGVTQAAPYRHFKNKEELFAALGQQGFEIQFKYMTEAWESHKHEAYQLYIHCGLSYFKMGQKHPQHFKLMFGAHIVKKEDYPGLLMAASKTFALLRNMVKECQKQGLVGSGDPYHRALNCWSMVHGFTSLYSEGRLEWLGVTQKNAESALKALLDQYLVGNKSPSPISGFSPFETEFSAPFRKLMEEIP